MQHADAAGPRFSVGLSPGMRYMIAGAFYFSVMSLAVKIAGQRLPSQQIVLVRGVLTVLFTWVMLLRAGIPLRGTRPGFLVLRGLLGFGGLSCFFYAITRLPLAEVTVLQYTNPVWTGLLAAWFLRERMSLREIALVGVSLIGVLVIARPAFLFGLAESRLDMVAVGIALLGAVFSAAAYVVVRTLGRTEHPLVIVFYFTLVTTAASLPGVAIVGPVMPVGWEWPTLLAVGITAQAGQVLITRGLQLEPAGRATGTAYMQVVFAAILGAAFFAEVPDVWTITGGLAIMLSTLALARRRVE